MDRVENYLSGRLRGRAVPPDLRRLVELQLDGELADAPMPLNSLRVVDPDARFSLDEPLPGAPPDAARAIHATSAVLAHVAILVNGFNGDLFGYWLHPDEREADGPAVVRFDIDGEFELCRGATLIDALVFSWALGDDTMIPDIAGFCDKHGLPLHARVSSELSTPHVQVDPTKLHAQLLEGRLT